MELQGIHNVFHVSNLRKTLFKESQKLALEDVELDDKLSYTEQPEKILDHKEMKLRRKIVRLVKYNGSITKVPT